MTAAHKHIVAELKKYAPPVKSKHYSDSYTGSQRFYYAVPVPDRRRIIKEWLRLCPHVPDEAVVMLADELFHGKSHEEKTMGAYLLSYVPAARAGVTDAQLDLWLGELTGWAEIDSLCQNVWQPVELLQEFSVWRSFLLRLAKSHNISKRRAALVFLVGPTSKSDDTRLHALAYRNIETLMHEKDILITKAISWLLRSMVDTHPKEVKSYLREHEPSLPAVAVRETRKKLEAGKKT